MADAADLRRHAAQYHGFADDALASCRLMVAWLADVALGEAEPVSQRPPACDTCRRCAEGYRAIAIDFTERAIRHDIIEGTVHHG